MKKTISIIVSVLIIGGAAYAAGNSIVESNRAEEKAFKDAGVTAESVYDLETDRDYENGKEVYEVEFESEGKDYEYKVDANTGEIIHSRTEKNAEEVTSPADIGAEEAKAIALKHAGVTEAETTRIRVERDRDDGRVEYSVEFHVGNKEYDYEIDATTGNILEHDVEVEGIWD